jgi:hypothetical protein
MENPARNELHATQQETKKQSQKLSLYEVVARLMNALVLTLHHYPLDLINGCVCLNPHSSVVVLDGL